MCKLFRSLKDYQTYVIEEQTEKDRLQKMIDDSEDESRVRQQRNVVEETSAMIPFTRQKLQKAANDLKKYLEDNVPNSEEKSNDSSSLDAVREMVEYKEAITVLQQIEEAKLI